MTSKWSSWLWPQGSKADPLRPRSASPAKQEKAAGGAYGGLYEKNRSRLLPCLLLVIGLMANPLLAGPTATLTGRITDPTAA